MNDSVTTRVLSRKWFYAFRLPGGAATTWAVLAFLALVVALMLLSPAYRVAVLLGPVWLGLLFAAASVTARRREAAHAG